MAYGFSVFWLPLGRAVGVAAGPRQGDPLCRRRHHVLRQGRHHRPRAVRHRLRLDPVRSRLDVHAVLRAARRLRRHLGRLARAGRAAQGGRGRGVVLGRRIDDLGGRRLHPPAVADVARLRHHRRLRPRPRLYLARLDPHQMVPRSPRHGDRHGHHGLRRRRHDRLAARDHPDEPLRHADFGRRVGDLRHPGGDLFRLHDVRRVRLSAAAAPDGNPKAGRRPPAPRR